MRAGWHSNFRGKSHIVAAEYGVLLNSNEAKEFLASRIVDQARRDGVAFSELERKILFYSEAHASLPDMEAAITEFDQMYNMIPYERVVSSLICNAYRRDRKDPALSQQWKDANTSLQWEDHYINVMLQRGMASVTRKRDFVIYVAIGIIVVLVIFGTVVWSH